MGFRFQKRIKIFPGVHLNLSKTGISTSVGTKGLTVNLRDEKVKTTVGLPGTGLSYSETKRLEESHEESAIPESGSMSWGVVALVLLGLVLLVILF